MWRQMRKDSQVTHGVKVLAAEPNKPFIYLEPILWRENNHPRTVSDPDTCIVAHATHTHLYTDAKIDSYNKNLKIEEKWTKLFEKL